MTDVGRVPAVRPVRRTTLDLVTALRGCRAWRAHAKRYPYPKAAWEHASLLLRQDACMALGEFDARGLLSPCLCRKPYAEIRRVVDHRVRDAPRR